ncbi:MAG: hypothetical protein KF709_11925 [Gemmatimonadaceae bacterium]|nr:hypothetical protein [Gemmatimonadaceae bacterium]
MFQTCIFCHKPLGANEVVEHFPVGRRLAFDAAKGRLWVVCRSCERWNLSPLDARWEAIEECEKIFRETRMRVSSDNVGLARLREGTELVRIGTPQRPEFAAWRYGDQFGRRRRRAFFVGGGIAAGVGAVVVLGSVAGISMGGFAGIWGNLPNMLNAMRKVKLRTDDGQLITIRGTEFINARFHGDVLRGTPRLTVKVKREELLFTGEEALRLGSRLLPAINSAGGTKRTVASAVTALEEQRGSEGYLERYFGQHAPVDRKGKPKPFSSLDAPTRLALEMALHEEAERRAIAGELEVLEAAWREAEEIAGIADSLTLPEDVERRFGALKDGKGEEE